MRFPVWECNSLLSPPLEYDARSHTRSHMSICFQRDQACASRALHAILTRRAALPVAAICGALPGAVYGRDAIPAQWIG